MNGRSNLNCTINIIAGCHCPAVSELSVALDDIREVHPKKVRPLPIDMINSSNGHTHADGDGDNDLYSRIFYAVIPNYFGGARGVFRDGVFYKRFGSKTADLVSAFPDAEINLHFIIEPTLYHLSRQFNHLTSRSQHQLATEKIMPPSWVPPLLEVSDRITKGSVTIWNLRSTQDWSRLILAEVSGINEISVTPPQIFAEYGYINNFDFDESADLTYFDLDLDAIDALSDFRLVE